MSRNNLPSRSKPGELQDFLDQLAATPVRRSSNQPGRLLFAMDATASREPTWDQASHVQAEMFSATDSLGGLEFQLCYFRGFHEFFSSRWLSQGHALAQLMSRVRCAAGLTQLVRTLRHALTQHDNKKLDAVIYIGDSMEENIDKLGHLAGLLGIRGVPIFIFHEGQDRSAERAFRHIARLSHGAYCPFDAGSPQQLKDLLSAVAVYAAGGRQALEDFSRRRPAYVSRLTHQVSGPG